MLCSGALVLVGLVNVSLDGSGGGTLRLGLSVGLSLSLEHLRPGIGGGGILGKLGLEPVWVD